MKSKAPFLQGSWPKGEATISPDDRGFLLGDGVYEVTPFYKGVPFGLDRHLERLRKGLGWLRIDFDVDSLVSMHHELIARDLDVDVFEVVLASAKDADDLLHSVTG